MNFKKNIFIKLVSSFLAGLAIFISFLTNLNLPVSAFGNNFTNNISIFQKVEGEKVVLDYYILQTFQSPSRGIFLTLPKNQDGVWTEYKIKKVLRSQGLSVLSPSFEENLKTPVEAEKFVEIKEWNEMRVRIGHEDKFLENGSYLYHVQIETLKSDKNQQMTLLQDWKDPIGWLEVRIDGEIYCNNQKIKPNCDSKKVQIILNPKALKVWQVQKIFLDWWLYPVILLIILALIYIAWLLFAKDPDYGFEQNKPEFEPPNLLPWEAEFLINDGQVSFKNTFLSYLLWLSHNQIIQISQQEVIQTLVGTEIKEEKINIQILQNLPDILPQEFNDCITKMAQTGFSKGIYDSKIHGVNTYPYLKDKFDQYYLQKRLPDWIWALLFFPLFFGIIVVPLFTSILQSQILLGNSYFPVLFFAYPVSAMGLIFILAKRSKLTKEGDCLKSQCQRYKFYIQKAEQYKLDFSNNPDFGVQYYLAALSFAASFGFLPQFQSYLQKLFPQNPQLNQTSLISSSFDQVTFYVPPSSSDSSDSSSNFNSSSGGFSGGGGSW